MRIPGVSTIPSIGSVWKDWRKVLSLRVKVLAVVFIAAVLPVLSVGYVVSQNVAAQLEGEAQERITGDLKVANSILYSHGYNVEIIQGKMVIDKSYQVNDNMQVVEDIANMLGVSSAIYQGDARIARTAKNIEMTAPANVAEQVLKQGKRYTGRAWVAGEEYLTAYDPIQDPLGNVIGMIYVGTPRAPYVQAELRFRNELLGYSAIITALIVIATGFLVSRTLMQPISNLVAVMRRVGSGDYSARSNLHSSDELEELSVNLNQMLDSTVALIQTREERDALQEEIKKLLMEVSNVAEGDLTKEAEVTPDVLGAVADSFNFMIEELRKIVAGVQTATLQVTGESTEILDSSESLAHGAEEQSLQISDTSAAVEEMTVSIQQVSENANVSAGVAQRALDNARRGEEVVDQTVEAMNRIRVNVQETSKKIKRLGESSQEIGEIVGFIDDIADQTNLLALNAAIQAAVAGEHGRGFAVVADEVRRLAERSASATKQITTLVKGIQAETTEVVVAMEESTREVVQGSKLADEAGQALSAIDDVVNRLAGLIESISLATVQQTRSAENVAKAMNEISKVTYETTNSTKNASERASRLVRLAEQLKASVSAFRLPS